jgi:hypothetical protein
MNCTRITDASLAGNYEGLWLFTSSSPEPRLEAWMSRLDLVAKASQDEAVPYEEALAAFDRDASGSTTRGGRVDQSPEERARQTASLDAASALDEGDGPFADLRRRSFFFRVER